MPRPPSSPRRVLVVAGDDRATCDRVARIIAARLPARLVVPVRCTCPMSVRADATHSLACPCSAGAA